MSLSPKEIAEIEAVIDLALGTAHRSQGVTGPHPADHWLHTLRATLFDIAPRLRALLPKPESLEDIVEEVLRDPLDARQPGGVVIFGRSSPLADRLRAALERRRKELGK